MSKNITKKKTTNIRGVLDIDKDSGQMYICIEDGDAMALSEILSDFDGCLISASVTESIEYS